MSTTSWKTRLLALSLVLALLTALIPLGLLPLNVASAAEYTAEGATAFTFTDEGITVTEGNYTGYKTDGTSLTIKSAGTYVVSGSCSDGSITVKKGTTGVTLVLNGLTLTSSDTAPLACNKSSAVTLVVAAGTTNTLTDSAINNDDSYPDNENAENAVIKCKDGSQVTICGSGTLNIVANGKNGIKSGATTTDEGEAFLTIQSVNLNITASVNDAINAEQLLNVESGTITISAADDAIHSDYELNIGAAGTTGPSITITGCYEGLEAASLNVYSGNISIIATDDCLNAANSDLTDYSFTMDISGGTISAYSSTGDGFDSNGSLTISGGTVSVWTANTADNQPLDADGTITISGGTMLAAGGSNGMGLTLTDSQPYITASGTGLVSNGSTLTITDSSGNALYSGTALCDAAFVLFSSGDLTSGSSYTISAGSTTIAMATATTDSTVSGGGQQPGGQAPDGTNPGGTDPGGTPPTDGTNPGGTPPTDGTNPGGTPPTDGTNPGGTPPTDGTNPGGGQFPGSSTKFADDDGTGTWTWAGSSVYACFFAKIVDGYEDNTYRIDSSLTRAEAAAIIARAFNLTEGSSSGITFTDADEIAAWAQTYVELCVSNGIINGYTDGSFRPQAAITRAEFAKMIAAAASLSYSGTASSFGDDDGTGDWAWASDMIYACAEAGIVLGYDDGRFYPSNEITRGQAAVIVARAIGLTVNSAS